MDRRPGSWRSVPLPPGWDALSRSVLERDGHRCRWGELPGEQGAPCAVPATQADHTGAPWDHRPAVLRAICAPHHAWRSSRQGGQAWGKIRKAMAAARTREPERHPGLI